MKKIIVTGGAGFIGSHLADSLIEEGHKVAIIDNLSSGFMENINPRAKFYMADLSDHRMIEEIFEKEKPEIVYHLAAQISISKSIANPVEDAKTNILSTINLLELCVKHKINHFIFSSTGGAIYSDSKVPAKESDAEKPVSPYGCAKLAIEKYLNFYKEAYGLKFTCLRYSNVYGPRQNPKNGSGIIAVFLNSVLSGKKPAILGGLQTRDFVYINDVVNANLMALNDAGSSVYNVGTCAETDMISLFGKISRFLKNKAEAEYLPKRKGEQMRSCLSYEKIKNQLGWRPLTSLDEGLTQTYFWQIQNKKNLKNF